MGEATDLAGFACACQKHEKALEACEYFQPLCF